VASAKLGLSHNDQVARAASILRQGKGARYDASNAPVADLLLARRGAAYFARQLNNLTNSEIYGASRVAGWTRAELISDISYSARDMATLIAQVRSGHANEEPNPKSDLKLAATLPAQALRYLFTHTDIHLNVEFRDLNNEAWELQLSQGSSPILPIRQIPSLRAKTLWLGAYNLGSGCQITHLPTEVLLGNPAAQYKKL